MAEVRLEGVSRVFPAGVAAVRELNLEARDRELLVLVGPSGCGKSTTLRMIAGLEEASQGRIYIGERLVNHVPPKDRDIAMVFQNYALYPHMTVAKNMAFGLELRYGSSRLRRMVWRMLKPARANQLQSQRQMITRRVEEVARSLDIEPLLTRLPGELSGGERQRVAVGRAIVRQPAVFLFDEPLSNLDARLRGEMRSELKQLHQRLETTMIYVTHDQVEALTLGQRVAVMANGTLQQLSPPQELYSRPRNRFVAGFIGSPPMNFIEGMLVENGQGFRFQGEWLTTPVDKTVVERVKQYAGRRFVLGIRPEHIQVATGLDGGEVETFPGVVRVVEPMGDAVIVHLDVVAGEKSRRSPSEQGRSALVAKWRTELSVQVGERVPLRVDGSQVHLFDAETGENAGWLANG